MEQNGSLVDVMDEAYLKFKLNFYRNLFRNDGLGEEGLTVMENFCVEAIYALEGPTINGLANFIQVSQPNAAYKVNNLKRKGYIEKVRSTKDRRELHLYVTEKFKDYYLVNYEYIREIAKGIEKEFSGEKLEHFKEVIEFLNEELMTEVQKKMDEDHYKTVQAIKNK